MPSGAEGLVLDASAFVHAHTETTAGAAAARRRIAEGTVHAPHLLVAEVGSVARRLVLGGTASAERGLALVEAAGTVVAQRYAHEPLARLAWALRTNVGFYDGLYVALAAALGLPLLTADARLARAPGLPCAVELISPPSAPAAATPS
jgi:predicted nucleic acid-binding protein